MKRKTISLLSAGVLVCSLLGGLTTSGAAANAMPLDKDHMLVWFDSTTGVVKDADGKVSEWKDQSGKGHDARQADGAFQPVLKEDAINGVPALTFENSRKGDDANKTGQFLSFDDVNLSDLYGTELTTVVISKTAADMPGYRSPHYTNLNAGTVLHFDETGSWGSAFLGVYADRVTLRYGTGTGNAPVRGWEYERPASNSQFTYTYGWKYGMDEALYVDGEQIAATDEHLAFYSGANRYTGVDVINESLTSTVVDKTSTTGYIGKGFATNLSGAALDGVYYEGEIAEILILDKALSDEEIAALNAYIEAKYQIAKQPDVTEEMTIPAADRAIAWFDAGQGVTAGDDGLVSAWKNLADDRRSAAALEANRPLLVADGWDGKPVLRFDQGQKQFLTFDIGDINQAAGAQLTMVAVSKAGRASPNGAAAGNDTQLANLLCVNDEAGWSGTTLSAFTDKVSARFGAGSLKNGDRAKQYAQQRGWVYAPADAAPLADAFHSLFAVKNARDEALYLDGVRQWDDLLYYRGGDTARTPTDALSAEANGNNGATVDMLYGNGTKAYIGKGNSDNLNASNLFYSGDIAEIIVYQKALSDAEIDQLNRYLHQKYGLPIPEDTADISDVEPYNHLLAWFDAADIAAADGDKISQWNDKSGRNRHAIQNVANYQPTYKADAVNGRPALVFAPYKRGTNDPKADYTAKGDAVLGQFLEFHDVDLNGTNARRTMIVVSKGNADLPLPDLGEGNSSTITNPGVAMNLGTPLFFNETGSWGSVFLGAYRNFVSLRYGAGANSIRGWGYQREADADAFTFTYGIKDTTTETLYVNGERLGGDNLLFYYKGGNQDLVADTAQSAAENNRLTANVANTSSTGWIGRGRINDTYRNYAYFDGEIAEILLFDTALDEEQLADVTAYLDHKYNGAAAKPAKVNAPQVTTVAGKAPELPGRVAVENYETYEAGMVAVTWAAVPTASYAKAGTFTVEGTLADGGTVEAAVTVIEPEARDQYGKVPTGAMAHYSASYGDLTERDGHRVWPDLSGNGRDAWAYRAENAPAFLPAGGERLFSAFAFDGVDDFLMLSGFDWNRQDAQFTLVTVAKPDGDMPLDEEDEERNMGLQVPFAFDEVMQWGQLYLGTFQDRVTMRFGAGGDGSLDDLEVRGWIYDRPEPVSGYTCTIGAKNGETETIYVDGKPVEDALLYSLYDKVDTDTRAISSHGWIGRGKRLTKSSASPYFKGEIAEIIFYDRALSEAEMKGLNDYLNYKYLNQVPAPDPTTVTTTTASTIAATTTASASGTAAQTTSGAATTAAGGSPTTGAVLPLPMLMLGGVSLLVLAASRMRRKR